MKPRREKLSKFIIKNRGHVYTAIKKEIDNEQRYLMGLLNYSESFYVKLGTNF